MSKKWRPNEHGISILEVCIIMAILGILAAVAIPMTGLLGPYEVTVDGKTYKAKYVYQRQYGDGIVWEDQDGARHVSQNASYRQISDEDFKNR